MSFAPIRPLAAAILALVLALGPAPRARAQLRSESLSQARIHFDAGETFYRLGEFRKALSEYQAALKLTRRPSIIFNIAQCYRQLGNHRKALFYYRLYLSDWARLRPGKAVKYRKEVDGHIARLYRLVQQEQQPSPAPAQPSSGDKQPPQGKLRLSGAPRGAELFVDGVLKARAPVSGDLELTPGVRRVEVIYAGAIPLEQQVALRAGEVNTLHVEVVTRIKARSTAWLVVGIAGAGLAVTAEALALVAVAKGNDLYKDDPDIDRYRTLSYVGHGVAGGLALTSVAGFVLYALSGGREQAVVPANVALAPAPGGGVVSGRWTF